MERGMESWESARAVVGRETSDVVFSGEEAVLDFVGKRENPIPRFVDLGGIGARSSEELAIERVSVIML